MTVTFVPRDRLAAPAGSAPMPPGPITAADFELLEEAPQRTIASHLVTARTQAQDYADSPTALVRLAQAEQASGEAALAVEAARSALPLAVRRGDLSAQAASLRILLACDAVGDSREFQSQAGNTSPVLQTLWARIAIQRGDHDEALRLLADIDAFEALMLRAWLALEKARYPEAIALLRTAQRVGGPTPGLLTNLGYAHAAVGSIEKAIKETREAQALAPGDRLIAFNLVAFCMLAGLYDEALRALDRLASVYEHDVELALVRADVHMKAGDRKRAHQTLQWARTSVGWARASAVRRAELEANLAFLRWIVQKRDRRSTTRTVVEHLERIDYRSLPIASLLPPLMNRSEDAGALATVVHRLEQHHDRDELGQLRVHLAVLQHDADRAAECAVEWSRSSPLNPVAASVAVHLLGDVKGRYDEAIELGYEALRRAPGDRALINNVAYTLAVVGRPAEARRLMARLPRKTQTVALRATAALIDLADGAIERGIAGYLEARDAALEMGDKHLAILVDLNLAVNLRHFPGEVLQAHGVSEFGTIDLPDEEADNASLWLLSHRAAREGLTFPTAESEVNG
jgi:tetratricopeptide (TPR) repeat protein